jgi:hypothetical protein
MRRYVLEPDLRLAHGSSAGRRAAEFTLDRQVDRFEALYRDLLSPGES